MIERLGPPEEIVEAEQPRPAGPAPRDPRTWQDFPTYAQAEAAGAKVVRPVEDQFYGDRGGGFEDPFGHRWFISTRKEDISPEEMKRRAAAKFGGS